MESRHASLLDKVNSLRWKSFNDVNSLLRFLSSAEDRVRLLLMLIERVITKRTSFYLPSELEKFTLDDLLSALTSQDFKPHFQLAASELISLLPKVAQGTNTYRTALLKALGSITPDVLLPDLIYELTAERNKILAKEQHSLDQIREVDSWDRLQQDVLSRFEVDLTQVLQTLLSKLTPLKQKSYHKSPLEEQRRFIVRREVINLLRPRQEALLLCLRFLLARFGDVEDEIVLIIYGAIHKKNMKYLRAIAENDLDADVRLRAQIVLANLDGSFAKDIVPRQSFTSVSHTLAYYDNILASRGRAYNGYTWLRDETVEKVLHDAFNKTDDEFSEFFVDQMGKAEEGLTEKLVSKMEEKFKPVQASVDTWSQNLANGKIEVNFSYRDTQPQEKDWHCDIAFLLKCSIAEEFEKQHAALIQCKKMNYDSNGRFQKTWTIDIEQCQELIEKSKFSYYFLFGPHELPSIRTLVVPATTISAIISATANSSQKTKNISYEQLRSNSRSLADFLLYDFIGCWVGDEDTTLIGLAAGGGNIRPSARFLVTVSISQNRQDQRQ